MARQQRSPAVLALAAVLLGSAACGGQVGALPSGAGTPAPTTAVSATAAPTGTAASLATEAPLEALELLWEATGEPEPTGQNAGTYGPAVDPLSGDIWVASHSDDVLWIFSKDGEFKGAFGKSGDGPGEFELTRPACRDCPGAGALAFAPDGSLFVADVGNHRVQKFGPKHEFEREWGGFGGGEGQFADAIGIATNGREVFVADDSRADIQVFDIEGTFLRTLPVPGWIAVGPDGGLLVSSFGAVQRYDANGELMDKVELPGYKGAFHIGLAADDRGRLFYDHQDNGTGNVLGLGEFDPATGTSRTWATGGETLAIAGDVLYEANFTSAGWPKPALRAYALPKP